jgi:hypothetical protein
MAPDIESRIAAVLYSELIERNDDGRTNRWGVNINIV